MKLNRKISAVGTSRLSLQRGSYLDLDSLRSKFLFGWMVLVVIQSLIWFSADNVVAAVIVVAGGVAGVTLFLRIELLRAYPLSTASMLGFTAYYFVLPPIATILEWKPLDNNLVNLPLVCFHALICFIALSAAHAFYRKAGLFQALRFSISKNIYRPLVFFSLPSNLNLFAI